LREFFAYDFDVVVPALNNYRYTILQATFPLDMYPVTLVCERPSVNASFGSKEAFEAAVEQILTSPEVRSALSHLKSQVVKP
jgi:hypothetical protein